MIWRPMATRRRRVVVDVDTQNHFFVGDSPLRVNDHLSVLDNVEKVLTWARNEHIHMVSTVQVHNGSAVYTVPRDDMPADAAAGAIFRY